MADYYPLLAKAVAGLPDATAEARHAVYERARKALFGQLRNLDPPVPEEVIEREAQALERAVAQLETDLAGPEAQAAPVPANELAPPPPPQPGSPDPELAPPAKPAAPAARTTRPPPPLKIRRDPDGASPAAKLTGAPPNAPAAKPRGGPAGSEGARHAGRAAGFGGGHGFYRPNRFVRTRLFFPRRTRARPGRPYFECAFL